MFSAPCTARSMSAFFSRSLARSASRSLLRLQPVDPQWTAGRLHGDEQSLVAGRDPQVTVSSVSFSRLRACAACCGGSSSSLIRSSGPGQGLSMTAEPSNAVESERRIIELERKRLRMEEGGKA
jgi:hypothetical protein